MEGTIAQEQDTRDGMVVSESVTLRSAHDESRTEGTLDVNLYGYDADAYVSGQLAFHHQSASFTLSGLSLDTLRGLRAALDTVIGFTEQDGEASS